MKTENLSAIARIRIRRPPQDVFAAFADPEKMSQYWFTRRDDGLEPGESVSWFVGSEPDAFAIDVRVKELDRPHRIRIDWGADGKYSQVIWTFEPTEDGHTILSVQETGFTGSRDEVLARALDSTGGFNQVVVAAKAFIEHGVALNVVADHA
ncbi:MAG: SRPBCC domain-containing protein [Gammaproteobacteria bacterium]|nr:SRPBCC domain-containing protein [Gammaproteobacteria bacterium]